MVGPKPNWNCDIITCAPKGKLIKTKIGNITMKRQKEAYNFGIELLEGRRVANKEKAFIDTCYYYLRGEKYPFDLVSDIDCSKLNMSVLLDYLSRYENPKFRTFTEDVLTQYGC